jgi:hypothetical protein
MGERFARIPARAVGFRELSAADWRVLACIALHADGTGRAYPGMTTIAAMTGIYRSNVPRSIRHLELLGILRRERRAHPTGSPDVNFYILSLEQPEEGSAITRPDVITADNRGVSSPQMTGVIKSTPGGVIIGDDLTDHKEHTRSISRRPAARSARSRVRDFRVPDKDAANSEFDLFWQTYPHRGEHSDPKKPAQLKFEAALKRGVDPAAIIAGARRYRAHVEQEGTKPQYVAQAKTWLNEERWAQLHEPEAPRLRVGMN